MRIYLLNDIEFLNNHVIVLNEKMCVGIITFKIKYEALQPLGGLSALNMYTFTLNTTITRVHRHPACLPQKIS